VRSAKPSRPAIEEIDDRAAARRLDERHALPRAVEHAVQVDGDAAVPVLDLDVLDLGGGPRDAGVVDQHVETAERALRVGEQALDVGDIRNVRLGLVQVRIELRQHLVVDVADVHLGAVVAERPGDGEPDARGAGSHDDA